MWTLLFQFYGGVFFLIAVIGMLFGWQKFLDFMGIDINLVQMIQEKPHREETR
jgi:hypothetical protein